MYTHTHMKKKIYIYIYIYISIQIPVRKERRGGEGPTPVVWPAGSAGALPAGREGRSTRRRSAGREGHKGRPAIRSCRRKGDEEKKVR